MVCFCFPLKHISLHHFFERVRSHHHAISNALIATRLLLGVISIILGCRSRILDLLVIVLFLMISIVICSCLLLSAIVLIIGALGVAILLLLRGPIWVVGVVSTAALLFAIVAVLHILVSVLRL